MSVRLSVEVVGDKEVARLFHGLTDKLQKKLVRRGMREAMRPALQQAKLLCPVDTGRLKKSLKIKAIKRSRSRIGVMIETGTRTQLGIPVTAKGYYPMSVETGYYNARARRSVPADPFLRPALYENRTRMLSILSAYIRRAVKT